MVKGAVWVWRAVGENRHLDKPGVCLLLGWGSCKIREMGQRGQDLGGDLSGYP